MITTTQQRLYITALTTLERIEIQFVPKKLSDTRTANIAELAVVGRNNPLQHYTSGTENMSLELDFYAQDTEIEEVIRRVRWLKALAAADGFAGGQERIRLTFGDLFKNNEVWRVRSVNSNYENFDRTKGFLPRQAYVTMELSLDPEENLRQSDIKWQ